MNRATNLHTAARRENILKRNQCIQSQDQRESGQLLTLPAVSRISSDTMLSPMGTSFSYTISAK